tara:strand:- start:459 stop:758 length:300 start_codon:yes stop_codon:yes gene_type:complete
MIDTEKYEGHTPMKEWGNIVYADGYLSIFINNDYMERRVYATDLDRQLMADAPLLLAEYKKLRERLDLAERYIIEPTLIRNYFADVVSKGLDDERDNLG